CGCRAFDRFAGIARRRFASNGPLTCRFAPAAPRFPLAHLGPFRSTINCAVQNKRSATRRSDQGISLCGAQEEEPPEAADRWPTPCRFPYRFVWRKPVRSCRGRSNARKAAANVPPRRASTPIKPERRVIIASAGQFCFEKTEEAL